MVVTCPGHVHTQEAFMSRSRLATIATAAVAAALLTLTACGGGGDTSNDNSALVDELMTEIGDEGMPEGAKDCIKQGLSGFSTEELTTLRDGQTDSDVPAELQDKVIEMMTTCVTE
jgi:hypothetical protein